MAKTTKRYSGRNGYSAIDTMPGGLIPPGAGRSASPVGQKTTVRSGVASSKTYLTTKPTGGGSQSYVKPMGGMDNYMGKTNKKKSSKKK